MSEEASEKPLVEKLHDVISPLKEMEHYSRSNIEKLSQLWLTLDDELKQQEFAAKMSDLLATQNAFQDKVVELSSAMEIECNRLVQEGQTT